MKTRLKNYINAGFPALALRTVEEPRAIATILCAAKDLDRPVYVWDASFGIRPIAGAKPKVTYKSLAEDKGVLVVKETDNPLVAAKATLDASEPCEELRDENNKVVRPGSIFGILVVCDLHNWVANLDAYTERAIKDLLSAAPKRGLTVIFLGADWRIPASFEKMVTVLDFDLPNREDLDGLLEEIIASSRRGSYKNLQEPANGERDDILRAASGLTSPEAENAFALAVIEGKNKVDAKTVYREKASAIRRSGLMEIVEPDPRGLNAIGGLDLLKKWVLRRKNCYTQKARDYGLPSPRGLCLAGVPGVGKSLAARCIGTALNVPTIRLDIGTLMAGIVGETEARTRMALHLAEAVAPCVLQIEEIEKALAGSSGSGDLDSGVGRRLLGTLLLFMQERKGDVFVVATSNQVWQLPAELLRAGRFDAIFFLDLPKTREREEIFAIHVAERGRDPKKFDMHRLAEESVDFTGSECKEAVISAMYAAFEEGAEISTPHIVEACKATIPISQTMSESIKRIREWGQKRALPASSSKHTKGDTFRQITGEVNRDLGE